MIGVAISTHQRPQILARALAQWAHHMPDVLVVTHDVHGDGVAATKNRGIAALMQAGCDHLFLADDDIWPINNNWSTPYVHDAQPHLMHCWGKRRLMFTQGNHTVWSHPRGVLLYVQRHVIATVGGMRLDFGRWGGEHVEWSRRIHSAGFTTYPFTDVTAARDGIWHCEDYTRATPSTLNDTERAAGLAHERAIRERFTNSQDFVEYH
jgi:hypothetical protein